MSLWQWSTTAANNASADPSINWAEGQSPSTVNDSARAMMAAIAAQYQNGWDWQNMGDTPTFVSATQFTVPGNLASRYSIGRRVRVTVSAGTVYGIITASAYTSLTTVTVLLDSGALDSGISEVDVGMVNPATPSIGALGRLTLNEPGTRNDTFTINGTNGSPGACLKMVGNGATTPSKTIHVTGGQFAVSNDAFSTNLILIDDSGNTTVLGNLTANSDERLKTDWEAMPADFIESLAALKRGTFTRIDTGQRQVGVGAQSLQAFMPEAVQGEDRLSVAYGQAALVACAELAAEVLRLRALLEPVK
jgi:hypothetical protein